MALYFPRSIFHLARLLYVRPETSGPYCLCFLPRKVGNNTLLCHSYTYMTVHHPQHVTIYPHCLWRFAVKRICASMYGNCCTVYFKEPVLCQHNESKAIIIRHSRLTEWSWQSIKARRNFVDRQRATWFN